MQTKQAADHLWFLNYHVEIAVAQSDNGDGLSVMNMLMPAGEAPPLHVHHAEDEIFHVLAGEVKFQVGGDTRLARSGDALLAPRGIPHGFRVTSPDGARMLVITRGGFEAVVREAGRPALAARLPDAVEPTPEMQQHLAAACARHQIDLLGPPIN